jgi:hypothetical protein
LGGLKRGKKNPFGMHNFLITTKRLIRGNIMRIENSMPNCTKAWDEIEQLASFKELMSGSTVTQCEEHNEITGIL